MELSNRQSFFSPFSNQNTSLYTSPPPLLSTTGAADAPEEPPQSGDGDGDIVCAEKGPVDEKEGSNLSVLGDAEMDKADCGSSEEAYKRGDVVMV